MNWLLLQNSLLVSVSATFLAVVLGVTSALWVMGLGSRWRTIVLALAVIALALPPFLVTNCWLYFFGYAGVWRSWLPLNIFSLGGTIWILALMLWPVTLFFVMASWQRLETGHFEVDPLLSGGALVCWLLVPMAKGAIGPAAVITFVLALNNFAVPAILQVKVFPAEVWVNFNTTFDYTAALQASWPLMIVPLLLLVVFRDEKIFWSWRSGAVPASVYRRQLGGGWFVAGGSCALSAIFFSTLVPLLQLGLSPKTWVDFLPALKAGQMASFHSLMFAVTTGVVVVIAGLLTWRWSLGVAPWVSFVVPGVLLGIALIWVFNRQSLATFYQSIGIVVLAFSVRYFGPGWSSVAQAMRRTDRDLSEAAILEGANAWQVFRHVHLPQIFPQLCAGWYVTYLLCLWDVETLVLIVPPGSETLSLRVFNLLHYGHNSQVNALCLWLLVLAVLPLVIWNVVKLCGGKRSPMGARCL